MANILQTEPQVNGAAASEVASVRAVALEEPLRLPRRILVVDDNEVATRQLQHVLVERPMFPGRVSVGDDEARLARFELIRRNVTHGAYPQIGPHALGERRLSRRQQNRLGRPPRGVERDGSGW